MPSEPFGVGSGVATRRLPVIYEPTTMTPQLDAHAKPRTATLYPPSADPCPACAANCCTSRVEVSIPDFVRFCATLALPFGVAFELVEGGQRPFELDVGPRIAVLRREADGYCRFLGRWDSEKRCGVYGVRPATCRLYPFTFRVGDVRHGPRTIRCPVPFGLSPDRAKAMKADARQAIDEWALHDRITKQWARRRKNRSLQAFLRFVVTKLLDTAADSSPILWTDDTDQRNLKLLIDHRVVRI